MPKRLAVIVDTFPRWSERFIARELSELRRRGVDFSVFCLKAGTEPAESDSEWSGLLDRRIVLPSCLLPPMRRYGARYDVARKELGAFYRRLGCAPKFAELLRAGGYEHVHAHFASLPSTLGWLAACTDADPIPFSMSVHARDLFVDAQLLKEKLADCKRVFCCHERAVDYIAENGGVRRGVLMHHGLPLENFQFAPTQKRGALESPEFLAAGRFVAKKGFHYAVEAMADARLVERDARLVLMGDGPELKKLARRVKALALNERVRFVPPGSTETLRHEFKRAWALLAPFEHADDGDADGIPNIILEAFALGVPVIGSSAGSLGEVLTPKTGTVINGLGRHPAALADALCAFIDNGQPAGQLRAARKLVERDFDISKNIEPLLKLLS
jgi:colanic acid/amylovoran biosynthesis glycosyltransferase